MGWHGKARKFNNKKVETAEGVFDSKGEWQRWLFLKEEQAQGRIFNLRRQVKYTLIPTQYRHEIVHLKTKDKIVKRVAEREVTYTADFVYDKIWDIPEEDISFRNKNEALAVIRPQGTLVVEDYKGYPNDRWPIKKALMLYIHGIAIREVKKPTEPI